MPGSANQPGSRARPGVASVSVSVSARVNAAITWTSSQNAAPSTSAETKSRWSQPVRMCQTPR